MESTNPPPRLSVASEALQEQRDHADETLADIHSHSSTKAPSADRVNVQGILRNYNTIEDFKNADKTALLDSLGDEVRSFAHSMPRTKSYSSLLLYRSGLA